MKLIGYDSDSTEYVVPKKGKTNLQRLYECDNGICQLCYRPCTLEEATIDHILPKSKGGGRGKHNTQLAHRKCNQLKSDDHQREPLYYINGGNITAASPAET